MCHKNYIRHFPSLATPLKSRTVRLEYSNIRFILEMFPKIAPVTTFQVYSRKRSEGEQPVSEK